MILYLCPPPNTGKPSSLKSPHPTQNWTFCSLVRQEVMIWKSEGFELLPVLKDQVPKKGCNGNPKLQTTLFTVFFFFFFNLSSLYSFRYISSVTLHGLNCFSLAAMKLSSVENIWCYPTSRCIFCSHAVYSFSLLFMSMNEYIFTLALLISSVQQPIFLKLAILLKDAATLLQHHIWYSNVGTFIPLHSSCLLEIFFLISWGEGKKDEREKVVRHPPPNQWDIFPAMCYWK